MFAQDATTNDTVGVVLGRTRGIAVYAAFLNPLFTRLFDIHDLGTSNFRVSATDRDDVPIPPGLLDINILLRRGRLAITFCIAATIAVCTSGPRIFPLPLSHLNLPGLITMILLLVMVTSVFFRFRQKEAVMLIPVTTLFAFTALRQSMPGAPDGFGMAPCSGICTCADFSPYPYRRYPR